MASRIIIGDSDEESGNDNSDVQEQSMESGPHIANNGALSPDATRQQHDSLLHDSTDSTELLNRDIRDAQRALMDQTPNWKMSGFMSMATTSASQSNTQNLESDLGSGSVESETTRRAERREESNTQTQTSTMNITEDGPGQKNNNNQNSQKISSSREKPKKANSLSNPRPEPPSKDDPWEFPGSSGGASDHNSTAAAGTGEMRARKAGGGSRASVKDGGSKSTGKRGKRKAATALGDADGEEEEDVWEPTRGSKVLEEPSNPRATRRQGSAGLVEGLKKRKRRGRTAEVDSGSATEISLPSKKRKTDARGGPRSSSSILVDLAKSEHMLSDSQKQQYEYISVESSLECPPLLAPGSQHSFAKSADLAGTVPHTTNKALPPDSASLEKLSAVANNTSDDISMRDVAGTIDVSTTKPIQSFVIEVHSSAPETSIKEAEKELDGTEAHGSKSSMDSSHLAGKSGGDSQSTREPKRPAVALNQPKAKKARKTSSKKGPSNRQPVIEEDESEADKIGLPVERYQARPSRSRAKHVVDQTAGNDIPEMKIPNTIEGDEEKAHAVPPSPRNKKRKKPSRKQPTATEPITTPLTDQPPKTEDDNVKNLDEPLQEMDNNEVNSQSDPQPLAVSKLLANGSPNVKLKSSKPDDSVSNDDKNKTAPNDTPATTTSLPLPRSPEKSEIINTKPPHSPLSNGRVPYRVGLSKRVKIQPLLRTMKR